MTDVIQTYLVSVPSIALARMALNLAGAREWGRTEPFFEGAAPMLRRDATEWHRLSAEYYRIIDRLSRGEKP